MNINIGELNNYINKLKNAKVLVIGDMALDEMVYGETERISREAPVLILQHTHTKYILGGASNSAHNASAINSSKVNVIGIIGNDYQGEDLKRTFEEAGINSNNLIVDSTRKTITKTRISGSCSQSVTQQIVRIDRQTNSPISEDTENKLILKAKELIPECDVVILSDYHIGTLTDKVIHSITDTAKKYSKLVVVDAQKDFNRYKDVTTMTPNLPDTQKYVGFFLRSKEDFIKAGMQIIKECNLEYILITCGSDGMVVVDKNGKYYHIPVFNKSKVFDVTGAGDTVTALYAMSLTTGANHLQAAVIGNVAASIVIKQFGCATTTTDEILENMPSVINIEE